MNEVSTKYLQWLVNIIGKEDISYQSALKDYIMLHLILEIIFRDIVIF